jgi:microcystin-dependent protein
MSRNYSSISEPKTLTADVSSVATQITLNNVTGLPSVPYVLVLNPDTASEEVILVTTDQTGVTSPTLKVSRAIETGASAKTHTNGDTVKHMIVGSDLQLVHDHIDNNSAHDATGGVVGLTKTQTLTNKTLTSPKINENVALTATATELNVLDGITASTTELNYVDGVTSNIQTQFNNLVTIPAGVITQFGGSTAPTGWVLCDGTAYSRTVTYNNLFTAVGTTYGGGDGSTTFNVPNLKGRVPVGRDASQSEFDTLAETGGLKEVTLTTAQIPNHSHAGQIVFGGGSGSTGVRADGIGSSQPDTGGVNGTTGGAHTNLQPYIVVNYIIKF